MIWQLFNSGWNDALRQVGLMESTHRTDEGPDSERWKHNQAPKVWNLQTLRSKVAQSVCDSTHPREGRPWRGPSPSPRERFSNYAKSQVGSKLRQQKLRRHRDGIKAETTSKTEMRHGGGVFRTVKLIAAVAFKRAGNSNIRTPRWAEEGIVIAKWLGQRRQYF